uniref:Uncharacterized protein n=1 Tax=Eutreptiella gymnastica TaxID=73025 RepID=A0A7S4LGS5_9EUGL
MKSASCQNLPAQDTINRPLHYAAHRAHALHQLPSVYSSGKLALIIHGTPKCGTSPSLLALLHSYTWDTQFVDLMVKMQEFKNEQQRDTDQYLAQRDIDQGKGPLDSWVWLGGSLSCGFRWGAVVCSCCVQ